MAFIRAAFLEPRLEPVERSASQGVSAVLLALYEDDRGRPELLYTRRTETLRSHPGEISFPGGRLDSPDENPCAAALREAEEEVGIPPGDVRLLGHLTDFLTHRDVLVCAYVGEIVGPEEVDPVTQTLQRPGRRPPAGPRSVAEVAQVFTVPIEDLLDPKAHESRAVAGMGRRGRVHYWHVGGRVIWGITGELTARFLQHVYGWEPPRPPRYVTDLSQFRPTARLD